MNLASCYVMLGTKGNPFPPAANASSDSPLQLATFHLKKAVDMDPRDPEIRFNLGAVLEASEHIIRTSTVMGWLIEARVYRRSTGGCFDGVYGGEESGYLEGGPKHSQCEPREL